VREQARIAPCCDETSLGPRFATRQAANGRANVCVREIQLGSAERRARRFGARVGTLIRSDGRVSIAQAHELLVVQRQNAIAFAQRLLQIRLLNAKLGACTRDLRLKRCRIDPEENLVLLDARAFLVQPLEKNAGHTGAYFHFAYAAQLCGVLERELQRLRPHFDGADFDRRHLKFRLLFAARCDNSKSHHGYQ